VKVSLGEPGVMKYSKSNRVDQLGKVITGWGMGGVHLLNSPRFMKGIRHIELKEYRGIYHVRFFLCAVGNFLGGGKKVSLNCPEIQEEGPGRTGTPDFDP
jgi:hypothetical protein